MPIESRNPATEQLMEAFEPWDNALIDTALARAQDAFFQQRSVSIATRAETMLSAAVVLERDKVTWATTITEEMGKPRASAVAEVEKCAWVCRYYAEHTEQFLCDEPVESDASRSYVKHLPIGPILAVMPWNFPFWQVFRFAAPALMAGNVGLLKHASNVPRSALAISEIFKQAGFEDGCFQTLLITSEQVEKVLADDRVKAATLTGSEGAGRAVASTAGKNIKPTVLELGGSDPFLVMPSADIDAAIEAAVKGRTINNGQSCIAAKRFIVHADVYEEFLTKLSGAFTSLRVGDPMSDQIDIGPLATRQIRDELIEQVRQSVDDGANLVIGGEALPGPGYFFSPGILTDIPEVAPAYGEELFGPVASVFKVTNFGEAITLANATRFGLGSVIFSTDREEIERAANEIVAGATFVNSIVASDPRLPFGGVKASGYGRELSRDGIRAFVNRKTIYVA